MAKAKTKFVFISLEERNGEREYSFNSVAEIPEKKDPWKYADELASSQHGTPDEVDEDDDGYYFNGGEVCVSIINAREITKEEFEVLKRFL